MKEIFRVNLIECDLLICLSTANRLRAQKMSVTPALCLRNNINPLGSWVLLEWMFEFSSELLFDIMERGYLFAEDRKQ
jgi:hypothetical protein